MPVRRRIQRQQPRAAAVPEALPRHMMPQARGGGQPTRAMPREKPRSNLPMIGFIFDLVRNIFYSREPHRQVQRRMVGTGFGSAFKQKLDRARRPSLPEPRQQAELLRRGAPQAGQVMRHQEARRGGHAYGVYRQKGRKAA